MGIQHLDSLKKFYKDFNRLPSYTEMLKLFSFSSKNSVFKLINKWIEEGFLLKEDKKLAPTPKFFGLPLLGIIKAGYPILAEENKTYLTLDEYLIDDPTNLFLLKVSGDSMVDAGIFEGDIVIIDHKKSARTGDIVLAEVDHEWTLKYLKKDQQKTYLQPGNSKYPPIFPEKELKIHGTVKGVVRKIS